MPGNVGHEFPNNRKSRITYSGSQCIFPTSDQFGLSNKRIIMPLGQYFLDRALSRPESLVVVDITLCRPEGFVELTMKLLVEFVYFTSARPESLVNLSLSSLVGFVYLTCT